MSHASKAAAAMRAARAKAATRPRDASWIAKCIGDTPVIYSKGTTDSLTDFAGAFLMLCISVYFTMAGYLFYRELALSE